jgi:hypothetical protein
MNSGGEGDLPSLFFGGFMKAVNEKSKVVLNKLWELAEKNSYYKLNNDPTYMPLTIEIIGKNQLSICHYGELNGDLMRDPEMVFYKKNDDWFPVYFRNDWLGVEEFSCNKQSFADFSNVWLSNIEDQQQL